jgi:hypothetical protein
MALSKLLRGGIAAAMAGVLGSCVDDSVALRIDCLTPPSADCTYPAAPTVCDVGGMINLDVPGGYFRVFNVTNGLKARVRSSPPLGETNGFTVDGFDVTLLDEAGNKLDLGGAANPYFVTATGYAKVGGATPAGGDVISAKYVKELSKQFEEDSSILMAIRVRATTDAHSSLTSAEITFPISFARYPRDSSGNMGCTSGGDAEACTGGRDADTYRCVPGVDATPLK